MTIQRPIIILGAPRSGTTLLFRSLALHSDLWHLPGESHHILEGPAHPKFFNYKSNRVTNLDLGQEVIETLREDFFLNAINLNQVFKNPTSLLTGNHLGKRLINKVSVIGFGKISTLFKGKNIRLLEKTPKNCLRVPFLEALFPDAKYLWLTRDAGDNIDSLIAGWFSFDTFGPFRRERFGRAGYEILNKLNLQDYSQPKWKFALVPEWESLAEKTVADVAAWQYFQCNKVLAEDLSQISDDRVYQLKLEDYVKNAPDIINAILAWANLPKSDLVCHFAKKLPRVNDATPEFNRQQNRWRHSQEIHDIFTKMPEIKALSNSLGYK